MSEANNSTAILVETRRNVFDSGFEGKFYPGIEHLEALHNVYLAFMNSRGYLIHPPSELTSGFDSSVRFIGSHISVLKPYLLACDIPDQGFAIVQNCIRTRNIPQIFNNEYCPKYGSFFTSLGGLAVATQLERVCDDIDIFLESGLGLAKEQILIKANSGDEDLVSVCDKRFPGVAIEFDTESDNYYRHRIGVEGVVGRNFNIALSSPISGKFEDVGNIIVIESGNDVLGIEIALGDTTILKQLYGLDHILDTYALVIPDLQIDEAILRKMQDAILTCIVLYQEGLRPDAQNNQRRILRTYAKSLAYFRRLTGMSYEDLGDSLSYAEQFCLPTNGEIHDDILSFIKDYDKQIDSGAKSNKEDQVIIDNLQKAELL